MFPNENLKINALLHFYPFAMDKVKAGEIVWEIVKCALM